MTVARLMTALQVAAYRATAGLASVVHDVGIFIRGAAYGEVGDQGGLMVTPGADDVAVTLAAKNANGSTGKPLTLSGKTTVAVKTGTPVANVGGKFALEHEDGTRWLEILQSGAGGTTIYGGPSASPTHAVSIRAPYVVLETTNNYISLSSVLDVYISHGTGRDIFHQEGGTTTWTERNDADSVSYFDWIAGVTVVELRKAGSKRVSFTSVATSLFGTNLTLGGETGTGGSIETSVCVLNAASGLYTNATTIYNRTFAQAPCVTNTFAATGVCSVNCVAGITSYELQHNASPRVAFDSTSVTLSGDVVYRENAAGTPFYWERCSSATISTATTTYVETFNLNTLGNGAYDVTMIATLFNTTDGESACYYRHALINRTGGTATQVGTTDSMGNGAGGVLDKESAGQTGNNATIDLNVNDLRFGVVTDSTDEHKWDVVTTIRRRAP